MSPSVIFTLASEEDGEFISVYSPGRGFLPADQSHVNFDRIKELCLDSVEGADVDPEEVADLFDIGETVAREFRKLTERVSVANGEILLDGDPVHGSLQDQILDFLDAGEDFMPLVRFYEKLVTNPLGDVREGLYDWITGQTAEGQYKLTITDNGDVIGYKAVTAAEPAWRTDEDVVYIPSRRGEGIVNGREVGSREFIEQVVGDVVEMPRSKVLHEPSVACGDGLHIGTYAYAATFTGDTVLMVSFSPRDIVSLPDSNSTWKLRVCRYTVEGVCTESLSDPVYRTDKDSDRGPTVRGLAAGDRCVDWEGDEGTVVSVDAEHGSIVVDYGDASIYGIVEYDADDLDECEVRPVDPNEVPEEAEDSDPDVGDRVKDTDGDQGVIVGFDFSGDALVEYDDYTLGMLSWHPDELTVIARSHARATADQDRARKHGKGGPTSQAAKGRGRNPSQDPATGRFVNGRQNSDRDPKTGRFVG